MIDAKILETTYFDLCTIKRKEKIKNTNTGVTETKEVVIAENVKCALSKNDVQSMSSDGIGKLSYSHTLFINPNVDLKEGDIVEVTSIGRKTIYLASKPFYYTSHSQTLLSTSERV